MRTGHRISPEREALLQELARFPFNFAGLPGRPAWQSLTEDEHSIVILAMDEFYDREFTNQFVQFADAGQLRPRFFGTSSRTTRTMGTLDPVELLRMGWRLVTGRLPAAGRPRLTEEWVHPSGGYVLIGPAQEQQEREATETRPPVVYRDPHLTRIRARLTAAREYVRFGRPSQARTEYEVALGDASRLSPTMRRNIQPDLDRTRRALDEAGVQL